MLLCVYVEKKKIYYSCLANRGQRISCYGQLVIQILRGVKITIHKEATMKVNVPKQTRGSVCMSPKNKIHIGGACFKDWTQ